MSGWGARNKAELEVGGRTDPAQKAGCEHARRLPGLGSTQLRDHVSELLLAFLFSNTSQNSPPGSLFWLTSHTHFIRIVQFWLLIYLSCFLFNPLFLLFSGHPLSLSHNMQNFLIASIFSSRSACSTPSTLLDTGSDARWIRHALFLKELTV